jgi:hypothetical protein
VTTPHQDKTAAATSRYKHTKQEQQQQEEQGAAGEGGGGVGVGGGRETRSIEMMEPRWCYGKDATSGSVTPKAAAAASSPVSHPFIITSINN